jgi:hypothetical protein
VAKVLGKALDRAFEQRYGVDTIALAKLDDLTSSRASRTRGFSTKGAAWRP